MPEIKVMGVLFQDATSAEQTVTYDGIAVLRVHGPEYQFDYHSENYTATENAANAINQAISDGGGTIVIIEDL